MAVINPNDIPAQVSKEFEADIDISNKHLSMVDLRQAELINIILTLENANNNLEQAIQTASDAATKSKYYTAISYNIDRLTRLYSTYREFEDTKIRYLSLITDTKFKKNKLVYLDIPKMDDQRKAGSDELAGIFRSLMERLKENPTAANEALDTPSIKKSKKYDL